MTERWYVYEYLKLRLMENVRMAYIFNATLCYKCVWLFLYAWMSVPISVWWSYGNRIGIGSSSINEQDTQSFKQADWSFVYESSDSEADRPDPDLLHDDLASRRFHTPSVITPTNFALPMISQESTTMPQTTRPKVMVTNVPRSTLTYLRSDSPQRQLH